MFLQAAVAQIREMCVSRRRWDTCVCSRRKLFPFSCLQNLPLLLPWLLASPCLFRRTYSLLPLCAWLGKELQRTLAHRISALARYDWTSWALHDINVDVGIYEAPCLSGPPLKLFWRFLPDFLLLF